MRLQGAAWRDPAALELEDGGERVVVLVVVEDTYGHVCGGCGGQEMAQRHAPVELWTSMGEFALCAEGRVRHRPRDRYVTELRQGSGQLVV
jgi:hypothetical protein